MRSVCSSAGGPGGGGHLPHQLLVVEGQRGLPAEDVHLALEDRHLHFAFHAFLGFGDAVAHKLALGTVPETCGEETAREAQWAAARGWGSGEGTPSLSPSRGTSGVAVGPKHTGEQSHPRNEPRACP